jgi:hypothetical protein
MIDRPVHLRPNPRSVAFQGFNQNLLGKKKKEVKLLQSLTPVYLCR